MSVRDRVIGVMCEVFQLPPGSIPADASNESVEQWDSLGHMNLCLALEAEFSVSFDDLQVARMTSLANIIDVVDGMSVR